MLNDADPTCSAEQLPFTLIPACPLPPPRPPPCPQFKQPKLDIKKDVKGVVTVPGATIVDNITTARELMGVIEAGLARRRVSSTAMNRESSRSHLIITVCIESTNLQTQSVARGKLSFVDLAGSERCVCSHWCCAAAVASAVLCCSSVLCPAACVCGL